MFLGWPRVIRSDGGPQFRGEFSEFCKNFRIVHELSSPYNPLANGLAKSGVKIVKDMLHKCLGEGRYMHRVLYEWRNLPKQHGYSPAQLLFGRSQELLLPQPAGALSPIDMVEAAEAMDRKFETAAVNYDRDKVSLPVLQPGQIVLVQCDQSKKWDRQVEIVEIRPDRLSYLVNLEGKVVIRGWAMLKPVSVECGSGQDQGQDDRLLQVEVNFTFSQLPFSKTFQKNAGKRRKMVVIACSSSDSKRDAAKLGEFQRMQLMHPQQTENTENTINQSSRGFSLINIQWASYATGATAIIVCALCILSVIVCFWIQTKNIRQTKARHSQLLDVLRSRHSTGRAELPPSPIPVLLGLRSQGSLLPSQPPPFLTSGSIPSLGGPLCQMPTSFQPLPSSGCLSYPFPNSHQSSIMEATNPSASVGFLAAGGTSSIPIGLGPSLSSGIHFVLRLFFISISIILAEV